MYWPQEVIDQVVGFLVESAALLDISLHSYCRGSRKAYQWDKFICCDYNPQPYLPAGANTTQTDACFTYPALRFLFRVRLVSRSWNASASRVLRRYQWWPISIDTTAGLERALRLCAQKLGSSDMFSSNHVIRRLEITEVDHVQSFMRTYGADGDDDDDDDDDETVRTGLLSIYTDKLHDRYIGDAQPDDSREAIIHPDKSAENKLLRRLIDNLTEVHAFSVIFPGATSAYDGATHPEAECYDLDSFDMAMGTILHGLRSQAFQHLVDLRLTVPGTHDIGKLAGGMSDDVKLQLKHLWLAVVDKTGPGGCWDYRFELEFSPEEYEDGTLTNVEDSGYAPSNLQAQYPNRDYQSEVWGFIQSCRNLESLAVHCTHYLSLDLLNWEPGPKSKGLHALSLARVYAHTSTLINLLAAPPSEAEPSIARRVEFREVKIYPDGGDWSTVCRWLADSCPKLEFFFPYNIGYFSSHPNFCGNNRPWENTNDIWTTSDEDNKSLVAIMGKLVKKAGGRHNYPADLSGYDYGSLEIEW